MQIAVVFETMYGATRDVAAAIAAGATEALPDATVTCQHFTEADPARVATADLLLVGGPTHLLGMSSGMSRRMVTRIEERAVVDGGHPLGHGLQPGATEGPGLREWLHRLPQVAGRWAAAFDTRRAGTLAGGAAPAIAHRLSWRGYELLTGPRGFLLSGDRGPLVDGESESARSWSRDLARRVDVGAATAGRRS